MFLQRHSAFCSGRVSIPKSLQSSASACMVSDVPVTSSYLLVQLHTGNQRACKETRRRQGSSISLLSIFRPSTSHRSTLLLGGKHASRPAGQNSTASDNVCLSTNLVCMQRQCRGFQQTDGGEKNKQLLLPEHLHRDIDRKKGPWPLGPLGKACAGCSKVLDLFG